MVLQGLADKLRNALKRIEVARHVDATLVREVCKEIQRAMLQADVNVKLVVGLTKAIEHRALTEKPGEGYTSRTHALKVVYEELVRILGRQKEIPIKRQRIMMVGLYGNGKTTTCGKLARYFLKRGLSVGLIAADVHRPAAHDQLEQLAQQTGARFFGIRGETHAAKIARSGLQAHEDADVVICDTSGRHALENELIEEMKRIANVFKPDETFLVMDATVGQQAGPQAKAFHDAIGVTGVVITKMDGTAKGGGALSAVQETKAPVVFIGVGEHLDDLETFDPAGFISRLLGMGDLRGLLEAAEGVVKEEEAEETARKLLSGKFTLNDLRDQIDTLTRLGPFGKIMEKIPGLSKLNTGLNQEQLQFSQDRLRRFRVILGSMTRQELEEPKTVKFSQIRRIAHGAGATREEVKMLLKYYFDTRKQIKGIMGDRRRRRMLLEMVRQGGPDMTGLGGAPGA